jgi:hypothetical protein
LLWSGRGSHKPDAPAKEWFRVPSLARQACGSFFGAAVICCCLLPAGAGEPSGSEEPPALGQTPEFSHLMGSTFTITTSATPTKAFVEDAIVLKVSIQGAGPFPNKDYLPQRKYLKIIPPEMERDFYIAGLPDRDSHDPKTNTWDFYYQLLPKNDKVRMTR